MKTGVILKQLSVDVSSSDQSYMPQVLTIAAGKNSHHMKEIKEIRISRYVSKVTLILSLAHSTLINFLAQSFISCQRKLNG